MPHSPSSRMLAPSPRLVMPRQSDWRGREPASYQIGHQCRQVRRSDRFGGCGQLGMRPPVVATVVLALELVQPGRIHLVTVDAAEEEVITEQAAGPAQVGPAGRKSDRVQAGGSDAEPGLFAQFPRRRFGESLAIFNATAGSKPDTAGPDQQQPVRAIKHQYPRRPAGELSHRAKTKAPASGDAHG